MWLLADLAVCRAGITFVSVHDCFWTHACDVEIMNKVSNSTLGMHVVVFSLGLFNSHEKILRVHVMTSIKSCHPALHVHAVSNDLDQFSRSKENLKKKVMKIIFPVS